MARSNTNTHPTRNRIKEILNYDPDTGVFLWAKCRPCVDHLVGTVAGHLKKSGSNAGYRSISIDGKKWSAHRLAWLWVYGVWPDGMIDHINRDRDDNRISNLRVVDPTVNSQNQDARGVSFRERSGKWHARICAKGQQIHLGLYQTEQEARAAYLGAKRVCHSSYFDQENMG